MEASAYVEDESEESRWVLEVVDPVRTGAKTLLLDYRMVVAVGIDTNVWSRSECARVGPGGSALPKYSPCQGRKRDLRWVLEMFGPVKIWPHGHANCNESVNHMMYDRSELGRSEEEMMLMMSVAHMQLTHLSREFNMPDLSVMEQVPRPLHDVVH